MTNFFVILFHIFLREILFALVFLFVVRSRPSQWGISNGIKKM